jgi:transcriptional regulator of acetoin/glycerol metabolism
VTREGRKEATQLRRLIREHKGSLSAIGRALGGISRQRVAQRLRKYDLQAKADAARQKAGITGPRPSLPDGALADPDRDRRQILAALAATKGSRIDAAKRLGISRRSIYRKIDQLGITPSAIAEACAR